MKKYVVLFVYLFNFFKTMSNLKPSILHPALKSNSVVTLYLIPQKQSSISESKLMATLPLPKLYGKVYKTLSTFATILKLCLGKRFLKEITPLKSLSNWILKNKIKSILKIKPILDTYLMTQWNCQNLQFTRL